MHSGGPDWSQLAKDWGGLLSTVILVIITAWYAYLTKVIAKAAKESAESAQESANAARRAALASETATNISLANLDVKFEVIHFWRDSQLGVILRSIGISVYIHSVTLVSVMRHPRGLLLREMKSSLTSIKLGDYYSDIKLVPESTTDPPVLLLSGEPAEFMVPEHIDTSITNKVQVAFVEIVVEYSVTRNSDIQSRHVRYSDNKYFSDGV